MDAKEASKLREGQRVTWDSNHFDLGTFEFHSEDKTSVWIRWDKSKVDSGWIHYNDMGRIEKYSGAARNLSG